METVLRIGLSNAAAAAALALVAGLAGLRFRHRPALVHGLWFLVLLKLLTAPRADGLGADARGGLGGGGGGLVPPGRRPAGAVRAPVALRGARAARGAGGGRPDRGCPRPGLVPAGAPAAGPRGADGVGGPG